MKTITTNHHGETVLTVALIASALDQVALQIILWMLITRFNAGVLHAVKSSPTEELIILMSIPLFFAAVYLCTAEYAIPYTESPFLCVVPWGALGVSFFCMALIERTHTFRVCQSLPERETTAARIVTEVVAGVVSMTAGLAIPLGIYIYKLS